MIVKTDVSIIYVPPLFITALSTPSRSVPSSCSPSRYPGVLIAHPLDDLHHLIADIVWMEHFHIVAIAADFLIEVISGMQAVGEYGVSILRAVVQYPLAAVQGSVLEVRGKAL